MRLIDADELKIAYGFTWDDITPTHEEMYALIDRQPSIDAVPVKHAKLLDASPVGLCSECGFMMDYREEFNYCPNCGARMDGEEDGKT